MHIDIITCLPKLLESPFGDSILLRAQTKGLVEVNVHDLRGYSKDKHHKVDDYAFGGGAGMVLMMQPVVDCINALKEQREYDEIIYMSPDGEQFSQAIANELSLKGNIMILCGHYKGVDERIREHYITREISIGDYVLSGGELAAAVVSDAVIRLLPGVLGDETSALTDSFQDGLVAPPVYTRPANFEGIEVPDILLSGHEKKIEEWRFEQAVERTKKRRPDLFNSSK
ncbi:tRNA (guanosine(37)-N1)-methyltransferase TrmD [Fulvivirga lutimaris]|uniref:tRNA (guanosine(37)-N1)-methyltransferase TrmD n=1 Tax=Fulvivirga lutimaris TaxID=1819566 RepID=UPI0012BCB7D9|nr:tRNA (guanosine(37)-N1)-methyltransferase TrmD [Fulvivirga lutimaris]MTI39981.1 tRNA (guanosine(37)-N1)-methyltransferase TrmD [Fulvivirga lutimaris]